MIRKREFREEAAFARLRRDKREECEGQPEVPGQDEQDEHPAAGSADFADESSQK